MVSISGVPIFRIFTVHVSRFRIIRLRFLGVNSLKELFDTVESGKIFTFIKEIGIQSTLVISKSKGPSETVRDIRTSTYQICSIEEKNNLNNQILQMTM